MLVPLASACQRLEKRGYPHKTAPSIAMTYSDFLQFLQSIQEKKKRRRNLKTPAEAFARTFRGSLAS